MKTGGFLIDIEQNGVGLRLSHSASMMTSRVCSRAKAAARPGNDLPLTFQNRNFVADKKQI